MTRAPEPPYWDHRGRREYLRQRAQRQLRTFYATVLGVYSIPLALTLIAVR